MYTQVEITKEGNPMTEFVPEPEITEEQLRQTVVSLYFTNKDTNTLMPEARSLDVKQLTKDPYMTLMNLLIGGPQNSRLQATIPEGTNINKIELKQNMLVIDLSKEFIENHSGGVEAESRTIYSIVNTMTQLNEIESIKIVIDGNENAEFADHAIQFTDPFVRQE